MKKIVCILIMVSFIFGFFIGGILSSVDVALGSLSSECGFMGISACEETYTEFEYVPGPKNRIYEDQILVHSDKIILSVSDASWATFADTDSMSPVLFQGANALQMTPTSPDEIEVGDIISYAPLDGTGRIIIHRVVYVGQDELGDYYIVKGDNNVVSDPGKVRFEQVKKVLFAIIY